MYEYEADELESIAFSNGYGYNNKVERSSSLCRNVGWDYHNNNLGVFNADMSHCSNMERFDEEEEYYSLVDDELSTGYLQDVLFEFTSKRRRLSLTHAHHSSSPSSIKTCWTSNLTQNFNTQMAKCHAVSEMAESKRGEEEDNEEEANIEDSSSMSSQKEWTPQKGILFCIDPIFSSADGRNDKRKKRVVAKVVYPFALVKPGGFEGDATINDINERNLMPPTRPVRHPVGDFACRPLASPDGLGLSGKAVVAFTRVQTQGRGTITIIRTRG